MADDDIDVEGEFDLKTELGDEFYDANELPSKSANLLPEFTSPAWMLEQGWSLDSCIDEKSKATIEKMLLEEQQYMYGRKTSRYLSIKKNVLLVTSGSSKTTTPNKSPWTQEEKNTFLRGMGIFGRSWSKIASLIPTRTSLQVKNYAQQYMKNLAKKKAEIEKSEMEALKCMTETPLFTPSPSIEATMASVTTGQPTVAVATTSSSCSQLTTTRNITRAVSEEKSSSTDARPKKKNSLSKQTSIIKKGRGSISRKKTSKTGKGKSKKRKLKSDPAFSTGGIVSYSDISQTAALGQQDLVTVISSKSRSKGGKLDGVSSVSDGNSSINGCSDLSNSSSAQVAKVSGDEESDVDVDIDIENDDDENSVLQSRSASPSSVYHQLLKSAHIEVKHSLEDKKILTNTQELSEDTEGDTWVEGKEKQEINNDGLLDNEKKEISDKVIKTDEKILDQSQKSLSDNVEERTDITEEEEEDEEHHVKTETIVNGLVLTTGEVLEFEIPEAEQILSHDTISDEEKKVHADFFDGRPPKTPERYLKIRNYIIDCWTKSKPTYLNKTSVRPGLKNCGDVNCIGRIHSYLECVGAINFGCELAAYRNPHKVVSSGSNSRAKGINKELIASFPVLKSDIRHRKRRIRNESGLWVDEKELEGKTIEHDIEKKKNEANKKTKIPRMMKTVYDPFKLVPCQPFSDENHAPYKIEMFNTALAIMDIHAHISKTEVIGMLGGQYCSDTGCLTISMAIPCKSMSTGMQCEMDPVSQTLASEQIEDVGMSVVGWYHSHPTFSPDPSVRDIETQEKFQYWFSKGGNHFVGVIISPYNNSSPSVFSDIRCLTISSTHSKEFLCNLPYKFDYEVIYKDNLREILGPASELAEKYSNYANRVMLSCQYKAALGITCLSKMLQSVKRLLLPHTERASVTESAPYTSGVDSSQDEAASANTESPPSQTSDVMPASPHSTSGSSISHSRIEEVLHWLEQIFLEKFSQESPRSPGLDGLASVDWENAQTV